MKNTFLYLIITLLFVTSCGGNDTINQDCYTCENTLTEYCIAQGDDFYTVSVNETTPTQVPLNGQYWSNVRTQLEDECLNGPQIDCFTCNTTDTEYCYLPGDDFYTSKIGTAQATQIALNGQTWAEIRSNLLNDCSNNNQTDCYTCASENTQYCFTEGDTFYTATVNGNETQTDLNGQTWEEIKIQLQNDCPATQTASIVGTWTLTDYIFTTQETTTINGNNINTSSVTIGVTYNSTETYTENPNESNGEGISILQTTITDENGNESVIDNIELEILDSIFWEINGNQLTKTIDGEIETAEIIELTNTSLIYKTSVTFDNEDLDGNPRTNAWETTFTFSR